LYISFANPKILILDLEFSKKLKKPALYNRI